MQRELSPVATSIGRSNRDRLPIWQIDRAHLIERLVGRQSSSVVLLDAPAGYGKTCLLAACHDRLAEQGDVVLWWQAGNTPLRDWKGAHGSALGSSRCHLFLDDLHIMTEDDRIVLSGWLANAPASLRFLLACRASPDIGLARLACSGALTRLGKAALRLSSEEAEAALAAAVGAPLDDGIRSRLDDIDGWPAGVGLLATALRYDADGVADCPFEDYFQTQVLQTLPSDLVVFLKRISIFDQVSAAAAAAVSGTEDAAALLDELAESGLFISPASGRHSTFDLNRCFRASLMAMLTRAGADEVTTLHRRAARWYVQQGRVVQALHHYREAKDEEKRALLLEAEAEALLHSGRMRVVEDHAADLRSDLLSASPGLLLVLAWLKTRGARLEEARWLLDRANEAIERGVVAGDLSGEALDRLRWLALHREMTLAAVEGKAETVDAQCMRLLKWSVATEPYLTASLYGQMIETQRSLFQFGEMDRLAVIARDHATRSGNPVASIVLDTRLGKGLHMAGRMDRAETVLRRAREQAEAFAGIGSSLAAMAGLPLAAVLRDVGDCQEARRLVDSYLPLAHSFCVPEQLMDGYAVRSSLAAYEGDTASAFQALADGLALAHEGKLSSLRLGLVAEKVRLLLRAGQPDVARDAAAEAGVRMHRTPTLPSSSASISSEAEALIWARVAIGSHRISEAVNLARNWGDFCARRGAVPRAVQWMLIKAELMHLQGDAAAATRALREAVRTAAPAGLLHPFREAGRLLQQLLVDVYADDATLHPPEAAFVTGLVAEMRTLTGTGAGAIADDACGALCGKLNDRERQILTLAASSMRNREIGQTLGLTEGTVKWYMCQIYDKTGTRRRMEAITRARQLALID